MNRILIPQACLPCQNKIVVGPQAVKPLSVGEYSLDFTADGKTTTEAIYDGGV